MSKKKKKQECPACYGKKTYKTGETHVDWASGKRKVSTEYFCHDCGKKFSVPAAEGWQ